ncbi:ThiF family adenylyltransferase [Candidatus Wolfebacteria bacterium]|nr:ThiF family adenylyltransferase [Candidatus Wolfebacteria bacterium]
MENPIIINPKEKNLEKIKKEYSPDHIIDTYELQLEDLYQIRNPQSKFMKDFSNELKKFIEEHSQGDSLEDCGRWVYFPWNKTLVHYLEDETHQEIRTARNKNIITKEEQDKFYNFSIGVAGLSVGGHSALTTTLMGGAGEIRLADPDVISPTNLNRIRFDFSHVGRNKADLVAEYVYQLNPYNKVHVFDEGITEENIGDFLDGLDLLVEELDDIVMKVRLREEAKKRGIPVIMATDNGDNVILDVERYDLNPDYPIFHGNLDGFDLKELKDSPQKMFEAMGRIIDITLVPIRVQHSIHEVGKTIYSWPQLASAATLSGVVIAYTARRIALGQKVKEGKLEINIESAIDPDYPQVREVQLKEAQKFLKMLGIKQ